MQMSIHPIGDHVDLDASFARDLQKRDDIAAILAIHDGDYHQAQRFAYAAAGAGTEQVAAADRPSPSMSLATILTGLRAAIDVIVTHIASPGP